MYFSSKFFLRFASPEQLSFWILILGLGVVFFSLIVLPGWGKLSKYDLLPAFAVRLVKVNSIWVEEVSLKANRITGLFRYSVNGIEYESNKDRRWAIFFRPYVGSRQILNNLNDAFNTGKPIYVFVKKDKPEIAYLTLNNDWMAIGTLSVCGVLMIGFGAFTLS
jgi:hypothetical protein